MENPILRKLALRLLILAIVIGAYGLGVSQGTPAPSHPKQYATDDLNRDGAVDAKDLSLFLSHYPKKTKIEPSKIEIQP